MRPHIICTCIFALAILHDSVQQCAITCDQLRQSSMTHTHFWCTSDHSQWSTTPCDDQKPVCDQGWWFAMSCDHLRSFTRLYHYFRCSLQPFLTLSIALQWFLTFLNIALCGNLVYLLLHFAMLQAIYYHVSHRTYYIIFAPLLAYLFHHGRPYSNACGLLLYFYFISGVFY